MKQTRRAKRRLILVASDSDHLRRALGLELSVQFAVIQASTYEEAVEALATRPQIAAIVASPLGHGPDRLSLLINAMTERPQVPRVLIGADLEPEVVHKVVVNRVATRALDGVPQPGDVLFTLRTLLDAREVTNERRRTPRTPTKSMSVRVAFLGRSPRLARAVDVSRGGILISVDGFDYPLEGETIHVSFDGDERTRNIPIECRVLRVSDDRGMRHRIACEFQNLDAPGLSSLDLTLATAQQHSAFRGE
jgi:hypothetical protein